uniref:Uncharacterized protein n=1 Tax=Caenorhabditis japonica TaxID=281687 RepID=A0A8R1HU57_CAEJA
MLDSIYLDLVRTIPSVEAMSVMDSHTFHHPKGLLTTGTLPAPSRSQANFSVEPPMSSTLIGKRSRSISQLGSIIMSSTPDSFSRFSHHKTFGETRNSFTNRIEVSKLLNTIEDVRKKSARLQGKYDELRSLLIYLSQWKTLINVNNNDYGLKSESPADELDDNVLVSNNIQ